ncbi:MAG: ABC transporter substrate-binding protein [Caldilineaceae bacterium]|nr:ABC transporter substrate-binding protein [Caldilineaceae bacterium]
MLLNRSKLVRLGWAVLACTLALALAACGPAAEMPAEEAPMAEEPAAEEPMADGAYNESPMLAEMVAAGTLPPVEERLPTEPFVVTNRMLVVSYDTEIGKYGGTMRLPQEGPGGDPHIYIGSVEPLVWAPGAFNYDMGIYGNVLKDWEANDGHNVYTLSLREGMKWSDGEPVTTADVDFTWNDVITNEEVTAVPPNYLRTGSSPSAGLASVEILDDYTFTVTFDGQYGSFPAQMAIAQWRGYQDFLKPAHYLKQFHADYADADELAAKMEDESIEEGQWYNLFNAKQMPNNLWRVINEDGFGHPVLTAWQMVDFGNGVWNFDRNPYYFKVDEAGNQLPYIDHVQMVLVQDRETTVLKILSGELDYLGERSSLQNLPLLKQAENDGVLNVFIPRMHRLPINFTLNLTYEDDVYRQVTQDVRFREAMNLAINNDEIIQTFYLGAFAKPAYETSVPVYDPDGANALLDEMGLDARGDDGFRLGPDGEPFEIIFEPAPMSQDHVPMTEMIAEHWKAVGINTSVKAGEWSLVRERWLANETQGMTLWNHEDIWPSAGWDDYLPSNFWGRAWAQYMGSGGEVGEEPLAEVLELYDLHTAFLQAPIGTPEGDAAREALYQNIRDNHWTFNPVEESYYPTSTSVRIKNTPVGQVEEMGIVIMYGMEQWYIDE